MTYNLCYFLGNKDFVIEFLRRGYSVVCVFFRPTGKEFSGKINIPHQNPNWPIILICLLCCCHPSTFRNIPSDGSTKQPRDESNYSSHRGHSQLPSSWNPSAGSSKMYEKLSLQIARMRNLPHTHQPCSWSNRGNGNRWPHAKPSDLLWPPPPLQIMPC